MSKCTTEKMFDKKNESFHNLIKYNGALHESRGPYLYFLGQNPIFGPPTFMKIWIFQEKHKSESHDN